ncbi:uncharacterized protein ACN427_011910 [Glossina fuscipes fuscipes]
MFRYRSEMYAHQFKFVYLALLILHSLSFNEAITNKPLYRRKPGMLANAKKATEDVSDVTEKPATEQAPSADSIHSETNQYRRAGVYSADAADYAYNNVDINLIRPENKPLHTKITTKYTSSISIPTDSLEDSETAEEYVAKAMGMFGSRLREPIHIPAQPEATVNIAQPQLHEQQQLQVQYQQPMQKELQHFQVISKPNKYRYYVLNKDAAEKSTQEQQQANEQQQQQSQQLQLQQQEAHTAEEHITNDYQYHQQQQQQPSKQRKESHVKSLTEAQFQAQFQEQMQQQQGQYLTKPQDQQQKLQQEAQLSEELGPRQYAPTAPVYEKDMSGHGYEIYEDPNSGGENAAQSEVDRTYRTKYSYKPASALYHLMNSGDEERVEEDEDKIRVSASTEIPKAEIMKQIEKSVMKYMKELEAEGKILTTPQKDMKSYYKLINAPGNEGKPLGSSTTKPRYTSTPINYQQETPYSNKLSSLAVSPLGKHEIQTPDLTQVLPPNVEFVYKIKTRAPLQTATVKTVSKPYSVPLKANFDQFDHASALKNLEEFDHTHVITPPNTEEHFQPATSASSSKSNKLYFNSEIYHDINSMPLKQKQRVENEYRKLKAADVPHPDYKGYGSSGGGLVAGYYTDSSVSENEKDPSGTNVEEYPILTPYQYVVKKESSGNKYEDSGNSNYDATRSHKYKTLDYENNYAQKYANNHDAYTGYQQHSYKGLTSSRHSPGKRGKRGGSAHANSAKKSSHRSTNARDVETSFALRPPPKV